MIDNSVLSAGYTFLYFMIHQMGGQLAGGAAALHQTPADPVILSFVIQLDNRHADLRIHDNVPEILSGTCHHEELSCQPRHRSSDGGPVPGRIEPRTDGLYLRIHQTVGKVAAVPFMPALLVAVVSHFDKTFYKFHVQNLHISVPPFLFLK